MSEKKSILEEMAKDKTRLIQALQYIQEKEKYISDQNIRKLSEAFQVSLVEIEGIISFYTQFKRKKPGFFQISVCDGTACHIKKSDSVIEWISNHLGIHDKQTDKEGRFSLEKVACLGCCSLAPVIAINSKVYGNLTRKKLIQILDTYKSKTMDKT